MQARILFSYAHPDDETFGSGGTIARYVDQGAQVSLICATGGELGTVEPDLLEGYSSVSELRAEELACASQLLGLSEVIMLGYRDSGMAGSDDNQHPDSLWQADLDTVARRVFDEIQRIRPAVVVTFDSFGGYGHPDHIKINRATTRAFEMALDEGPFRPEALLYSTFNRRPLKMVIRIMRMVGLDPARVGRNKDLDLNDLAAEASQIHLRVKTGRYRRIAWQAAQCHQSQLTGASWLLMSIESWLFFGVSEAFEQAYPPVKSHQSGSDLLVPLHLN